MKTNCPHCNANLVDFFERDGKIIKGSRQIGVEIMGVYDGALYNKCPDCGGVWNRWKNNECEGRLYRLAEKYMKIKE